MTSQDKRGVEACFGASSWPPNVMAVPPYDLPSFRELVWKKGVELYRDLPWRRTRDPYGVWLSEVMLQQTQVSRVDGRWQHWLERFPTIESLASAEQADVLQEWQGMGYNRRALALRRSAQSIVKAGGQLPRDTQELVALPGIGPATAAGIRAFAFGLPGVYLETNVRTVFLHELFPREQDVPDRRLVPLVRAACPEDDPRRWYYALLDYGAWLKQTVRNPSRRSSTYVRQSGFEGSHRQKRAAIVRILLNVRPRPLATEEVTRELSIVEQRAERMPVSQDDTRALLEELSREGFCEYGEGGWRV